MPLLNKHGCPDIPFHNGHLLLAQAITRDAITTTMWGLLGGLARCESETELKTLNP